MMQMTAANQIVVSLVSSTVSTMMVHRKYPPLPHQLASHSHIVDPVSPHGRVETEGYDGVLVENYSCFDFLHDLLRRHSIPHHLHRRYLLQHELRHVVVVV